MARKKKAQKLNHTVEPMVTLYRKIWRGEWEDIGGAELLRTDPRFLPHSSNIYRTIHNAKERIAAHKRGEAGKYTRQDRITFQTNFLFKRTF